MTVGRLVQKMFAVFDNNANKNDRKQLIDIGALVHIVKATGAFSVLCVCGACMHDEVAGGNAARDTERMKNMRTPESVTRDKKRRQELTYGW